MRRVLIIGPGGAGKTTLARRLAARTGLPLVHLDALYWRPNWVPADAAEWDGIVASLLAREEWIIDGNYGRTLPTRLAACDTVVFLDRSRFVCLWRLLERRLRFGGRTRPDLPEGCPERLTWEFVRWVWDYPRRRRPLVLDQLEALDGRTRVHVLGTDADVDRFVDAAEAGAS